MCTLLNFPGATAQTGSIVHLYLLSVVQNRTSATTTATISYYKRPTSVAQGESEIVVGNKCNTHSGLSIFNAFFRNELAAI